MISNFSEVEKSLKRCLKEKVSITAATVVGFLIAGTVAFGGSTTPTDVTFETASGGVHYSTADEVVGKTPISETTDSISVDQYLELAKEKDGALKDYLTVKVEDETGIVTFAGNALNLTKVIAKATENGALTLIKTDENHKSITSSLTIEAAGEEGKLATAMSADGEGHTVTNDGTITVGKYAVGMSAKNGGTAVNNAEKTITVNATDAAVGMSATTVVGEKATLTNLGKIDVIDGTGIVVDGAGTTEVTFEETGTIEVAGGKTGISVAGTGTTNVTGGKITGKTTAVGIDVASGTGTLTIKDTKITVGEDGTGIKATGNANITLKDGVILDLNAAGTGTGIAYTGGSTEAKANISTGDIDVQNGNGIIATMSKAAGSTLDITTGSIKTAKSKTGITITGAESAEKATDKEKATTATVTTTLGETAGTGVEVAGKANNDITVNLGAADVVATADDPTTKAEVSGIGVKIAGNEANGKVVVNVNQKDLSVADGTKLIDVAANAGDVTIDAKQAVELLTTANLVNIGATGGNITVNLNADKQAVATGSLVNVGAITGTTNVNINKDVAITGKGGNIVKAAANLGSDGILNINLNVKEGSLNVKEGKTAINLEVINTDDKASVKNTGTVTIAETGTLLAGSDTKAISLTNQGLITLETKNDTDKSAASHISTGEKVNVANYGTIKLDNISLNKFLEVAGNKKSLEDVDNAALITALKALGVIDEGSDGTFSTIGYIEFKGGETFTTAKALDGNATVAGLAATLAAQPKGEKGFEVQANNTLTLTSESEKDKLENVQLNLKGTMKTDGSEGTVVIDNSNSDSQILIREDGKIEVASGTTLNYSGNILASEDGTKPAIEVSGTLTLSNGTLTVEALPAEKNESGIMVANEAPNRVGIKLANEANAVVKLDNYAITADIAGTLKGSDLQGTINSTGISAINGTVTNIKDIKVTENGMLKFGADSVIANTVDKTTTINLTAGNMGVQIGENGKNVLLSTNPDHIKLDGLDASTPNTSGKVVLLTDALTENTEFDLGNHDDLKGGTVITDGDIYYTIVKGDGSKWNATFNEDALLEATGTKYLELGNIFVCTQAIHDLLSKDPNVRVAQLDDLYSNNIYSETVKMSLDTLKMNEDAVLSLNVRPKQGEFTAQGKFLFNNTDYDREGVTRDYKVETKNNGLLGALEYGLTDTSSVGFAFSGTKQDLDMKNGASAAGDAFYFGLYRNDTFNNIDLTTGLGYMIDRVDAENFIGKDKFDSTALSGYIQGKYNYAIGENLTLSPKARLTVTRFQQDSINNGRMKQEEIKDTMADVELGVELKKGIALETGKMNLLAGASFTTNVAGKDDDYYKVNFISKAGNNGPSTKVKGANLEKNSLKLNVGADVELTNGVFYNGGLSYEFDDEDRDSIGVTLGAGYKF